MVLKTISSPWNPEHMEMEMDSHGGHEVTIRQTEHEDDDRADELGDS